MFEFYAHSLIQSEKLSAFDFDASLALAKSESLQGIERWVERRAFHFAQLLAKTLSFSLDKSSSLLETHDIEVHAAVERVLDECNGLANELAFSFQSLALQIDLSPVSLLDSMQLVTAEVQLVLGQTRFYSRPPGFQLNLRFGHLRSLLLSEHGSSALHDRNGCPDDFYDQPWIDHATPGSEQPTSLRVAARQ